MIDFSEEKEQDVFKFLPEDDKEHAEFAPSNTRWPYCASSHPREKKYPDIAGAPAIDGTGSHIVLDLAIRLSKPAMWFIDKTVGAGHPEKPGGWFVREDRALRVQVALDYIERRRSELSEQFPGHYVEVKAESKSDPGKHFGVTDWNGTADITFLVRTPHLHVIYVEVADFKDGRSPVSPESTQLQSYLGGVALDHMKMRDCTYNVRKLSGGARQTIIQPKSSTPVRYIDLTAEEVLYNTKALFNARVKAAKASENDPGTPGEHCRWCKARQNCAEFESAETADTSRDSDILNVLAAVQQLSKHKILTDDIAEIERVRTKVTKALTEFFTLFQKTTLDYIKSGYDVPGVEETLGRGKNEWKFKDKEMKEKFKGLKLRLSQYEKKTIISVADFMKLETLTAAQKEAFLDKNAKYTPGKPTIRLVKGKSEKEKLEEALDKIDVTDKIQF